MEKHKTLKTPMNDVLIILEQPKQLNETGMKELIEHLNFDNQTKINPKDMKMIKIINSTYSAGVDEGVRECLFRLMKYPGFKVFMETNIEIE